MNSSLYLWTFTNLTNQNRTKKSCNSISSISYSYYITNILFYIYNYKKSAFEMFKCVKNYFKLLLHIEYNKRFTKYTKNTLINNSTKLKQSLISIFLWFCKININTVIDTNTKEIPNKTEKK